MYGLIVKLTSAPGRRDELIAAMGGEDSHTIPGCLSFIVAEDATEQDVLWITEVWESEALHYASLRVPAVKENLTDADSLIAAYEKVATTSPVRKSSHPIHAKV